MSEQPTLLVLGAGPFQLPGIKAAAARGLRVLTVDNVPGNVGHAYGHGFVHCSTTDVAGVLRAAREQGVGAVCTFCSDVAVPAVAAVAEALGLPGPSLAAAVTMSHKARFRQHQQQHGLPGPRSVSVSSASELEAALQRRHVRLPVVCKPVRTSGSRGVTRLDTRSPEALEAAVASARRWAGGEQLCVEEWVEGVEVGGDALLQDGAVVFAAITHKRLDGFVVTGHSLPGTLAPSDEERVRRALEDCCRSLGYATGPLNFDVMVAPERVVVLEMSPRTGGNGIAAVIRRATGVDVEVATIRSALGSPLQFSGRPAAVRACGSLVFGAPRRGRVVRCASPQQLRERVPEVFEAFSRAEVGELVEPFEHNGNLLGYALFDCPGQHGYERVAAQVSEALELVVEPGGDGPNTRRTDQRGARRTS